MGKAAIITGATSGIGRALAVELARRGYALGLTARRTEILEALRRELTSGGAAGGPATGADGPAGAVSSRKAPAAPVSTGGDAGADEQVSSAAAERVAIRRLDVRDTADVHAAIVELDARLGGVGLVVANAGIAGERRVGDGNFALDEDIVRTNLLGAMATIDAAVALLRERRAGQIVGISSVAAFRGLPGNAAYSASKAGLTVYLEGVRAEVEPLGVAVTTLSPGYIDTPLNEHVRSRPFVVSAETGARQIADLIERRVRHSAVPVLPWSLVSTLMRSIPDPIWYRAVRAGVSGGR